MERYGSSFKRINCIVFVLVFLGCTGVFAAYHCVRPGGSSYGNGSGADWANARGSFGAINWSAVRPGDTLFIAGGRYGEGLRIRASGSSGAGPITVLRAAASIPACTSLRGWSDAFDNTVVIDRQFVCLSTLGQDRITIDGVRDNGIRLVSAQSNDTRVCEVGFGHNGSSHITLRNLEIVGTGKGSSLESTGIYAASSTQRETDHVYHNLTIHGASTSIKLHSIDRVRITGCRLYDSDCSGPAHENIIWAQGIHDLVYDGNYAYDYIVEGVFARADNSNWLVCNSVFRGYPGSPVTVYGFATKSGYANTNMRIYNNTFHNIRNAVMFKSGTSGEVANNIFHSCVSATRGDYNWYSGSGTNGEAHGVAGGSENPFVDLAGGDLRLREGASPIDRGRDLGRHFTTDMSGATRLGAWDIGAYECGSAGGSGGTGGSTKPPTTTEPADSAAEGDIVIEAESGVLVAPMLASSDPQASGGRYVATGLDNAGSATYTFTVPEQGRYRLRARVQAPSNAHNSFELRLDNGTTETWDITTVGSMWRDVDISFRDGGTPEAPGRPEVIELLEAGTHTLTILGREDDTKLDRILLVREQSEPTGIVGGATLKRDGATPTARPRALLGSRPGEAGSYSVRGRRIGPRKHGAAGILVRPPERMRETDR